MVARQKRNGGYEKRDLENEYNFYNSENRDFIYANGLHAYTTTSNEEYNYITIQPHIFKQIMNISEIKKVEQNLRVLRIKTEVPHKKGRRCDVVETNSRRSNIKVIARGSIRTGSAGLTTLQRKCQEFPSKSRFQNLS